MLRMRWWRWGAVAIVVAACAPPTGSPLPVLYSVFSALPTVGHPTTPPAGSNDWSCRPTAEHPRPVVLVHGTLATMGENWGTLSPLLKDEGYCVFALDYGANATSAAAGDNVLGLSPVPEAAAELSAFVDDVLHDTGASQVDIVGHSQGGMMPNYYIKFLGGAPKVHTLVGLAPDNHGTTLDGLVTLGQQLSKLFPQLLPSINAALDSAAPSIVDQEVGSPFMAELNSRPDTVPGVSYTVIATRDDEIVTPYQSQFLAGPNVQNVVVQDQCGLDDADHIALAFDHIALRDVLNALDPQHAVAPTCSPVSAVFGG